MIHIMEQSIETNYLKLYKRENKSATWIQIIATSLVLGTVFGLIQGDILISNIIMFLITIVLNIIYIVAKSIFYPGQFGQDLTVDFNTKKVNVGDKENNLDNLKKLVVISIRRYGTQVNLTFEEEKVIRVFSKEARVFEEDILEYFKDNNIEIETKNKFMPGVGKEYIIK